MVGLVGPMLGWPPSERGCHKRPSSPSLSLDTHLAPEAGQGQEGEARADTGPFVSCSPHGPAPKPIPTPAPGWAKGVQCPPGRGQNSGCCQESDQCPGSTAFWWSVPAPGFLISKMRRRELDSGTGGG